MMVGEFPGVPFEEWNAKPCHYEPKPEDAKDGHLETVVLYLIAKVSDVDGQ